MAARRAQLRRQLIAGAACLLVGLVLAGCGALLHSDAVRLCRALIPVFNGSETRIDVRRSDAERTVHGLQVVIAYAVPQPGAVLERRAISCIFRENDPAGRLDLTNLATEDGPIGEVRLHLIKRHWIDKGHAVLNDPAPVMLAAVVPDIGHSAAAALQVVLASLGGTGIYAVLAASLALIHGLTGRIHLGIGDLAMLGGYGAFLGYWIGFSSPAVVIAAPLAVACGIATATAHGTILGRPVFARLADRPGQHSLFATLGLAIAWSELARLAQGSGQRWLPPFWREPIAIARGEAMLVTITPMGLIVPLTAGLALLLCLRLMATSRFGRQWRAVADDAHAAALMGVSRARTLTITMLLASALAGLGGLLTVLAYGGIGHAGGLVIGLKALIAAVIGGVGSVRAAVLGALVVGAAETVWAHLVGIDSRDLALFVALGLVLIIRPDGLFTPPVASRLHV